MVLNVKNKGYFVFPFNNELSDCLQSLIRVWKHFYALSEEEKELFKYLEEDDSGFEIKTGKEVDDKKENLDITLNGLERLKPISLNKSNSLVLSRILLEAETFLTRGILPVARRIGREFEIEFGLPGLEQEMVSGFRQWKLRLLSYPPRGVAHSHVDRSGITLVIWESVSGLQYLDFDWHWRGVNFGSGSSSLVAFPGLQMQYCTNNEIKALCHRVGVVPNRRLSVTCFIGFPNIPQYDKEKYGPLKDWEEGFNYDLELPALRRLFKPLPQPRPIWTRSK